MWKARHPSKTCSTGIIRARVSLIAFSTGSPEQPEHFSALELHLICPAATQKGCGCPDRDRAWLSPGRRQGRKNLPAPTPRLLHILLSWMTAWCNCHIDNPSNMEGFSSWSREVANGDVSSEMTMHLKTSRASASLWIFFFNEIQSDCSLKEIRVCQLKTLQVSGGQRRFSSLNYSLVPLSLNS